MKTPLLNPEHATRRIETLLGNSVADAYRDYHLADIGWANGGGIRAEAPGPDFTLRDAYVLAPFDNKIVHVEVRGAGLRQALEEGVLRVADLGGGFPQVSEMAFAYDPKAPAGEWVGEVTVAGEPLDENATYTVAVTNYVVNGGDAITGFADAAILVPVGQAPADAEAIAAHARSLAVIDLELEGRIVIGDSLPVPEPELPETKPGLPETKPQLPKSKPGLPKTGAGARRSVPSS